MEFFKNLTKIMESKNISAYKLSKDTGIGQTTISSWKKGKLPTIDKLVILVQYFGVSANEILGIQSISIELTENEKELLEYFNLLPEREQIKSIGRMEEIAKEYKNAEQPGKSSTSRTG